MSVVTENFNSNDLQRVGNLQLLAKQVVEGLSGGVHKSPHKGVSVEFKQHRQYVPGDEIRHLDWKVFGKTDRFYIREYEEETTLRATLLLDCSGSMGYGDEGESSSDGMTKHQYASRLAACLAYLMLGQQDSVGLVTFDEKLRNIIPTRSRPSHLRVLMEEMDNSTPGGESQLSLVFREIAPKLKRRGLVVVISDCFCDVNELLKSLAYFRHAKHEVIVFQIWHPDELDFPFKQWSRFECLERDGSHQMIDPAHLREAYLDNLRSFREQLSQGCSRRRIDLVPIATDQPYAEALAFYLARRMRKK